jgi:dienelactone hydrolase
MPVIVLAVVGCRHRGTKSSSMLPPTPVVVASGVSFVEVVLPKFSEKERLWIFEPKDGHKVHPCVFVAAEGEDTDHGARLRESDRPSFLPYAEAGYTVVAFDVSGELLDTEDAAKATAAVKLFAKREVGTLNGVAAIDYALHHIRIDPIRLYVAGHGAAGTLALQLAAADSRIRGCVAYAPIVPAANENSYAEDEIGYAAPEALRVIKKFALSATVASVQCPVMLSLAENGGQSPPEAIRAYAKSLSAHGDEVDLTTLPEASDRGIRAGIEWMGRARRKTKPAKPNPVTGKAAR